MNVFVVGDHGPEHNTIKSIHKAYPSALKAWNELRKSYLGEAKSFLKKDKHDSEMWKEIIVNLSCEDPKSIDNYPQETPYIKEYEVEE